MFDRLVFKMLCIVVLNHFAKSQQLQRQTEEPQSILMFKVVKPLQQVHLQHRNCRNDSQWIISATAQVVQPSFIASSQIAHRYVCFNEDKSGILRIVYMEQEINMHLYNKTSIGHAESLHVHCSVAFWMLYHNGLISLRFMQGSHLLLQTYGKVNVGKVTVLTIDGYIEASYYRGKEFTCIWNIQDYSEFVPVEHVIKLHMSLPITMPVTNVRASSTSGLMGDAIACLYDGYPRAHSVVWQVIKSEHANDLDSYYNKGKENNDKSGDNRDDYADIKGGDDDSGSDQGRRSSVKGGSEVPSRNGKDQAVLRIFESGKVEVRCSVNNSYDLFEGATDVWRGSISVEPIDIYKTPTQFNSIKIVKEGDILHLNLPQCSEEAVWIDGEKRTKKKMNVVVGNLMSKRYVAFDHTSVCGGISVVVLEKELHMKYPRKKVFTIEEEKIISCSVSGWFSTSMTQHNSLIMLVNGEMLSNKSTSSYEPSTGVTSLNLEVHVDHYLGDNEVACLWQYQDRANVEHVQEIKTDIHIWMSIKWVRPNMTTSNEDSYIDCMHLSYPLANCYWTDNRYKLHTQTNKSKSVLKLAKPGKYSYNCTCVNHYHGQKSSKTWTGVITVVPKETLIRTEVRNRRITYILDNRAKRSYSSGDYIILTVIVIMNLNNNI